MPSHHAGIQERRDAHGRTRYRVRVRRGGGVATATLPTLAAAVAWKEQALSAVEGVGDLPERPTLQRVRQQATKVTTVEDASRRLARGMLDGSIRSRDGRPYKPSVVRKYEEQLRLLILPRVGGVPVATLARGDVQRLVDDIAAERTAEHGRKALTALRVALRVCERYGELDANPCAGVRVPVSPDGEKASRILTPEEADAIVSRCEADDLRLGRSFAGPFYALAFGCGLRMGELLALEWGRDGLDLDAGVIRVRATLDRVRDGDGVYRRVSPKSRAGRRDVPITPEDVSRLLRHSLATGRPEPGMPVFASDTGKPLSPVPAYRAFKRACVRAGIVEPSPRPHDARHAFATHALAAGLSVHAVAELLGHSDPGLVWRRYGHALPAEVAGAGDALSVFRKARGL